MMLLWVLAPVMVVMAIGLPFIIDPPTRSGKKWDTPVLQLSCSPQSVWRIPDVSGGP